MVTLFHNVFPVNESICYFFDNVWWIYICVNCEKTRQQVLYIAINLRNNILFALETTGKTEFVCWTIREHAWNKQTVQPSSSSDVRPEVSCIVVIYSFFVLLLNVFLIHLLNCFLCFGSSLSLTSIVKKTLFDHEILSTKKTLSISHHTSTKTIQTICLLIRNWHLVSSDKNHKSFWEPFVRPDPLLKPPTLFPWKCFIHPGPGCSKHG